MSFDSPRRLRYCGRVKRYFDENDPVSYVEGYIYNQEDILSLKTGREDAWPGAVMPGFLRRCDSKFLRVSSLQVMVVMLSFYLSLRYQ